VGGTLPEGFDFPSSVDSMDGEGFFVVVVSALEFTGGRFSREDCEPVLRILTTPTVFRPFETLGSGFGLLLWLFFFMND
jgi:hypothetical protein